MDDYYEGIVERIKYPTEGACNWEPLCQTQKVELQWLLIRMELVFKYKKKVNTTFRCSLIKVAADVTVECWKCCKLIIIQKMYGPLILSQLLGNIINLKS